MIDPSDPACPICGGQLVAEDKKAWDCAVCDRIFPIAKADRHRPRTPSERLDQRRRLVEHLYLPPDGAQLAADVAPPGLIDRLQAIWRTSDGRRPTLRMLRAIWSGERGLPAGWRLADPPTDAEQDRAELIQLAIYCQRVERAVRALLTWAVGAGIDDLDRLLALGVKRGILAEIQGEPPRYRAASGWREKIGIFSVEP